MDEQLIVEIAVRRGRTLDQPDLADQATAQLAWEAWTPLEGLLELPREAEDLIDAASASLGHLTAHGQRWHAWRCAEAAASGTRPAPPPAARPISTRTAPARRGGLAGLSATAPSRLRSERDAER